MRQQSEPVGGNHRAGHQNLQQRNNEIETWSPFKGLGTGTHSYLKLLHKTEYTIKYFHSLSSVYSHTNIIQPSICPALKLIRSGGNRCCKSGLSGHCSCTLTEEGIHTHAILLNDDQQLTELPLYWQNELIHWMTETPGKLCSKLCSQSHEHLIANRGSWKIERTLWMMWCQKWRRNTLHMWF